MIPITTFAIKYNLLPQVDVYLGLFTLLLILLFIILIYPKYLDNKYAMLLSIILLFLTLTLPTILNGVIAGYDSWWYIGSAESIIADNRWDPNGGKTGSHQFPGIQLLTIFVSETTSMSIVLSAKYITPLIKILPILTAFLFGYKYHSKKSGGAVTAITLVGFGPFYYWFPYHHMLMGVVLKLLFIYLLIRWHTSPSLERWPTLVLITFISILVTHQLSTFHSVIILLVFSTLLIVFEMTGYSDLDHSLSKSKVVILSILSMSILLVYYIWVTPEFFRLAILIQFNNIEPDKLFAISFLSSGDQTVEVIAGLEVVQRKNYFESGFPTRYGLETISMALLLLISATLATFLATSHVLKRRTLLRKELFLPVICFAWVGLFGIFRLSTAFNLGFFIGTRRLMVTILPVATIGILLTASDRLKKLLSVILVVFIILNGLLYPAYYFDSQPSSDSSEPILFISEDQASALEWASSKPMVGGVLADTYVESRYENGEVYQTPRVYTKNSSATPKDVNIYVDKEYKRLLFMRGTDVHYRIPTELYDSYNSHSEWNKIYSNRNTTIYQPI